MSDGIVSTLELPAEDPARFDQLARLLDNPGNRLDLEDFLEDTIRRKSGHIATKMLNRTRFYAEMVEREGKRLGGKEQLDALTIINEQFPRIVEAVDDALDHDDATLLSRFASNIAMPLLIQGKLELGASVFERLLKQAELTGNRLLEVRAATQYGSFLKEVGRLDEALELLLHALELAQLEGNESALAEVLICLGDATPPKDHFKEEIAYYTQALGLARKLRDKNLMSNALSRLGIMAYVQGRLDNARQLYAESLELSRETGYIFRTAKDLHNLANVVQAQGEYHKAQSLFEESLELNRLIGNRITETRNLMGLARIAMDQGRFDEAKQLFSSAQSIAAETGRQADYIDCEHGLGAAAAAMENYKDAIRHFETGIQLARGGDSQIGTYGFLQSMGALHCELGEYKAAKFLLLEAMTYSKDRGTPTATSFVYAILGLVSLRTGKLPEAVANLAQALDQAVNSGRLNSTVIALQACVLLLADSKRFKTASLLICGITQHMKRIGLAFGKKWHRQLDEAMAKCSSMLDAEELHLLEQQAASISIEDLTAYALEEVEKLKTELNSQQA